MSTGAPLPTHAELTVICARHQRVETVARVLGIDPRSCACTDYENSGHFECFFVSSSGMCWLNNIVEPTKLSGTERSIFRLQRMLDHHRQELGPAMVAHLEIHIAAMLLQAAL